MNVHVSYRSRLISYDRVCILHFIGWQALLHDDRGSLNSPSIHSFNF